jgi:hypothetical protein
MHITIKKHQKHNLKLPQFLCDYPLKKDVPPPFDLMLTGFKFIVFCAKPGMGKTSLLVSCLLDSKIMRKTFNHVFVCMPRSSRASLKKNPFDKHDESKLFDDLDSLSEIYQMLEHNSGEGETSLLVIDDLQSSLKRPDINLMINRIASNRRHLKTSIIICLQNYNLLPLSSRKLINILVTWKPSVKEWESISDEMIDHSDKVKEEIYEYAFKRNNDDGHNWLLIDTISGRMFAMFDEIQNTSYDI